MTGSKTFSILGSDGEGCDHLPFMFIGWTNVIGFFCSNFACILWDIPEHEFTDRLFYYWDTLRKRVLPSK